jgi:hypothetical protein
MKDFTLFTYKNLLESLKKQSYTFQIVEEYFSSRQVAQSPCRPIAIMRHDVDRKPNNSLRMAKVEADLGIKATYYFRIIPKTFKPKIIKEIAELGHEIGYHYENLCDAEVQIKNLKFNIENYEEKLFKLASEDFEKNLEKLREIVPIKNIAMHGRPTSKLDSRDLWKKYNYKDYGINSEPYFDIDFNKVQYITDAGRSWDNAAINLRDKVESPFSNNFKYTEDIIKALQDNQLAEQLMINIHPEHWAGSSAEWFKIWAVRKAKNAVKKVVIGRRKR